MVELAQARAATGIALIDHVSARGGVMRLVRMLVLWLAVPLGLVSLGGWIAPGATLGIFLIVVSPLYYVARSRLDEFAIAAAIGFLLVGLVPALNSALDGDWRHAPVMAVTLGFMAIFEALLRRVAGPVRMLPRGKTDLPFLLGWLALAIVAPAIAGEAGQQLAFILPFAASLTHFARLCPHRRSRWIAIAGYAIALGAYGLLYWNHFGRLLMGAMVAMPLLLLVRQGILRVSPIIVLVAIGPLLWFSQKVRGGQFSSDGIANSSVSGPSQISVMMAELLPVLPTRLGEFADQWLLFFFAWVPRGLWTDKPAGLGWILVDELTSRRGVSEGHSIAPGLVGESLWLLGDLFILGFAAQVAAVALLGLLLRRLSAYAGLGAIIVAALLPTLIWGGMASFGARLWLFLLPFLLVVLWLNIADRNRTGVAA